MKEEIPRNSRGLAVSDDTSSLRHGSEAIYVLIRLLYTRVSRNTKREIHTPRKLRERRL